MIEFLRMNESNYRGVYEIQKEALDMPWSENDIKNEIGNKNAVYICACSGNEVLGYIGFYNILGECDITSIAVKKAARYCGIGSTLMKKMIEYCKNEKCVFIALEVNENNIGAISLYEKFDFKIVGSRKKYYNNTDDALLMKLKLK